MNETNPFTVLTLAEKAIEAMDTTATTPGEKVAALRTAAFAIEQAQQAQQLAIIMANMVTNSRPK